MLPKAPKPHSDFLLLESKIVQTDERSHALHLGDLLWLLIIQSTWCRSSLTTLSSKRYLYKVAMEERRNNNKSINKVEAIFQNQKPRWRLLPRSMHVGHFPTLSLHLWQTAGCLLNLAITKLIGFHTNMCQVPWALYNFGQDVAYSASGCQLFPVEQRAKSGSNFSCWVMLLLGLLVGTLWHKLRNRVCQAPVDWGGGRIDSH